MRSKTVTAVLLALVLAVAMVLPITAADGNETTMANETAFVFLANSSVTAEADVDNQMMNADTCNPTAELAIDAWDPAEPDAYESGNVSFPAEGNYLFQGEPYTFVWTSDFPGNHVSIGIVPVGVNETNITWMFIRKDRPTGDRLEFDTPFLNEGVYRTVFAIDGEQQQVDFFGDTFFIEENQVYVSPPPESPEPRATPSTSWW